MSLARPGRRQATFPVFYVAFRFITALTTAHQLSLTYTNQSISLPFKILTVAVCLFPRRAKDLSTPSICSK
jgi:prolipoprotein diacylglyceryltransferase